MAGLVEPAQVARDLLGDRVGERPAFFAGEIQPVAENSCAIGSGGFQGRSVWAARGQLAESNAAQVAKARRILEELGFAVASPGDARDMLKLKGARNVAF